MKRGRVLIVMIVAWVLLLNIPASAEKTGTKKKTKINKQINVFGTFGVATSQVEDALMDFGVEFQLTRGFYFRLVANSHLDTSRNRNYYPGDYYYSPYYYTGGFGLNSGTTLHGVSTFAVYKAVLAKSLKLFLQAGLNYMSYWRTEYETAYAQFKTAKRRGYGGGLGTGFEYYLSEKFLVIFGGTYRLLFDEQSQWHPDEPPPGKPSWIKIYVGLGFRVKGS